MGLGKRIPLLVATFGPSTEWVGKTIEHTGDEFIFDGHTPISAADVMEYDRQGHLAWVSDDMRAWVSRAGAPAVAQVAMQTRSTVTSIQSASPGPNTRSASSGAVWGHELGGTQNRARRKWSKKKLVGFGSALVPSSSSSCPQ
jgi:hypothetical protein